MNQKVLETLEYHKIIPMLTEYASTPLGKETCRKLLPMTDLFEIQDAQANTTDAVTRLFKSGHLSFSGVRDIRDSLKRLAVGAALGIPELLNIAVLLEVTARAKAYNKKEEDTPEDSLDPFFHALESAPGLCREIRRCLLSEEEVSDDATPALKQVRRQMHALEDRVHSTLNAALLSNADYLQDHVITMRDGRYCLPVKAEHKGRVQGIVHDQSSSGSTYFIEPISIVRLNNELKELQLQEQKEIDALLASLSNMAAAESEHLAADYEMVCHLDFIFAKASLSRQMKGSEPRFNTEGRIHLKDARHPLLDPKKVVPITVTLGDTFDLLIVTGPNTGGKTVSIKTTGLLTLMGQAGLHIPAFEGSSLAVFQEVFADIGDEQSIEQSLSTFSSHMVNIVSILEKADSNSLVLFDELCAGTDPVEGAALAMSILTFLHNMKTRTMATTHYSELKLFALSTEGVENASCEFNVETLSPTYRLLIGIPGKSNAFAISKKLGLPEYLIEQARANIGEEQLSFEDVISDLENTRTALEKEQSEAEQYKLEIKKLRERLSRQNDNLDEKRERQIREANEEAKRIVQEANAFADETIRQVNKITDSSSIRRELELERQKAGERLNALNDKLAYKTPTGKKPKKAEEFHIGDAVKVLSLNVNGTVSTLPNAKGDLYVQMGILRSLVNIRDLELLQEDTVSGPGEELKNAKRMKSHASGIKMSKSYSVATELNIIGKTVDEAMPLVDKYVDDAWLAHLEQVRIIHGRGTGALKNAVHNMLKKMKNVKSFRLGEYGEGSGGVTIVELNHKKK